MRLTFILMVTTTRIRIASYLHGVKRLKLPHCPPNYPQATSFISTIFSIPHALWTMAMIVFSPFSTASTRPFESFFVVIRGFANFRKLRQIQIIFRLSRFCEQTDLAGIWICTKALVLRALDERNLDVVRSGAKILILLASKNVKSNNVCFCMPVLASLRSRDFGHFARMAFDHNMRPLSKLSRLLRVHVRRTGVAGLKSWLIIRHAEKKIQAFSNQDGPHC